MLVDDKLAKEKLIKELQQMKKLLFAGSDYDTCVDLIRNTDLTDCQVMAPDQGSVRNATDEQDAKRYRWMRDNWAYAHGNIFFDGFRLEPRDTLDDAIDAAIRALPDQKD